MNSVSSVSRVPMVSPTWSEWVSLPRIEASLADDLLKKIEGAPFHERPFLFSELKECILRNFEVYDPHEVGGYFKKIADVAVHSLLYEEPSWVEEGMVAWLLEFSKRNHVGGKSEESIDRFGEIVQGFLALQKKEFLLALKLLQEAGARIISQYSPMFCPDKRYYKRVDFCPILSHRFQNVLTCMKELDGDFLKILFFSFYFLEIALQQDENPLGEAPLLLDDERLFAFQDRLRRLIVKKARTVPKEKESQIMLFHIVMFVQEAIHVGCLKLEESFLKERMLLPHMIRYTIFDAGERFLDETHDLEEEILATLAKSEKTLPLALWLQDPIDCVYAVSTFEALDDDVELDTGLFERLKSYLSEREARGEGALVEKANKKVKSRLCK